MAGLSCGRRSRRRRTGRALAICLAITVIGVAISPGAGCGKGTRSEAPHPADSLARAGKGRAAPAAAWPRGSGGSASGGIGSGGSSGSGGTATGGHGRSPGAAGRGSGGASVGWRTDRHRWLVEPRWGSAGWSSPDPELQPIMEVQESGCLRRRRDRVRRFVVERHRPAALVQSSHLPQREVLRRLRLVPEALHRSRDVVGQERVSRVPGGLRPGGDLRQRQGGGSSTSAATTDSRSTSRPPSRPATTSSPFG